MSNYIKLPFCELNDTRASGVKLYTGSGGDTFAASPPLSLGYNQTLCKVSGYFNSSGNFTAVIAAKRSNLSTTYGRYFVDDDSGAHTTTMNAYKRSSDGDYIVYRAYTDYNASDIRIPILLDLETVLNAMDDGDWEWSEVNSDMIQNITIWVQYPTAGQPLASSVARVRVDTGTAVADSITWEPAGTTAENETSYIARISLTAQGSAYFSGSIGNHVAIIETGESGTRVRQAELVRDLNNKKKSIVNIYFTPTGVSSPYDQPTTETSQPVAIPPLPTGSALATGFISLYNPTASELSNLASFMWSNSFIDNIKKAVSNPYDTIISLSLFPVHPNTNGRESIKLGYVSSGVECDKIVNQFYEFDCGSVDVSSVYGAYIDHNPYTKIQIYLPYVGYRDLDIDEVTGKSLGVVYHIDFLSGACVALITADGAIIAAHGGTIGTRLPISATDRNPLAGLPQLLQGSAVGLSGAAGGNVAAAMVGGVNATMGAMMSNKITVNKGGTVTENSGMLAMQKPFLIIERPVQALPASQQHFTGFPTFKTARLGDLQGYTEIANIHLQDIDATAEEIDEIETLLKGGVIC